MSYIGDGAGGAARRCSIYVQCDVLDSERRLPSPASLRTEMCARGARGARAAGAIRYDLTITIRQYPRQPYAHQRP
eukprot:6719323-Prymnesium_polylepis.1